MRAGYSWKQDSLVICCRTWWNIFFNLPTHILHFLWNFFAVLLVQGKEIVAELMWQPTWRVLSGKSSEFRKRSSGEGARDRLARSLVRYSSGKKEGRRPTWEISCSSRSIGTDWDSVNAERSLRVRACDCSSLSETCLLWLIVVTVTLAACDL